MSPTHTNSSTLMWYARTRCPAINEAQSPSISATPSCPIPTGLNSLVRLLMHRHLNLLFTPVAFIPPSCLVAGRDTNPCNPRSDLASSRLLVRRAVKLAKKAIL